jgi:hypothetical protein
MTPVLKNVDCVVCVPPATIAAAAWVMSDAPQTGHLGSTTPRSFATVIPPHRLGAGQSCPTLTCTSQSVGLGDA